MTSVQQEVSADPMIKSSPLSDADLQPAGETGSGWYDFSESGAITSDIWDKTISNTDKYPAGTTLFAIDANPVSVPGGTGGGKPPSMASYLVQTFRQMVFKDMIYTFVCSKGSLTNAKLIAAFIPSISLEEFSNLSDEQKKSMLDRQSNKVIFSPSPNETNVLVVNWAHTTSIVNVGENMGIVALSIYQKVVANIADGGSNDIHITTRFSVNGLKCRYPVPPGLIQDNNVIELDQLELFQPCNPKQEQSSLPYAHTSGMANMPTMVAIPRDIVPLIPERMFSNAITKDGNPGFYIQGINNMFNLPSHAFRYFRTEGQNTSAPIYEKTPYQISMANVDTISWKGLVRFPFELPEGADFEKLPYTSRMHFYMTKMETGLSRVLDVSNIDIVYSGEMILIRFDASTELLDLALPEAGQFDSWSCGFVEASHVMKKGNITRIPDFAGEGDNRMPVTHVVGWSSIPTPSAREDGFFADDIVNAIKNGQALPLVTNLTNQIGNSIGNRNSKELAADMVIGGTTRGPLEFIGKVLHTAESFMPLLSILGTRRETTVVAEASEDFPIYYVDSDTAAARSVPTGRVHFSTNKTSRSLF